MIKNKNLFNFSLFSAKILRVTFRFKKLRIGEAENLYVLPSTWHNTTQPDKVDSTGLVNQLLA